MRYKFDSLSSENKTYQFVLCHYFNTPDILEQGMIKSFHDSETKKVFHRLCSTRLNMIYQIGVGNLMAYERLLDADTARDPVVLSPVHPGDILLEEFIEPHGLSQNELARRIGVSPRTVNEIVRGRRAVTADTALRLGRFFGTSAEFWMNLQKRYELDVASDQLREKLQEIAPLAAK